MHLARVAKLADARDLKSRVPNRTYRFDSGPGHHLTSPADNVQSGRGIYAQNFKPGRSVLIADAGMVSLVL